MSEMRVAGKGGGKALPVAATLDAGPRDEVAYPTDRAAGGPKRRLDGRGLRRRSRETELVVVTTTERVELGDVQRK